MEKWRQNIDEFIELADKHNVQMLMVGSVKLERFLGLAVKV